MKKINISILALIILMASSGLLLAQCSGTLTIVSPTNDVNGGTAVFQGYETILASNAITNNADASIYAPNIILQNGMYVAPGSQLFAKSDCKNSVVVATDDVDNQTAIHTFPNPVTNKLNVNLDVIFAQATYTLYDVIGKTIQTAVISNPNFQISMKHLPAGAYLLTIVIDNEPTTIKILK